MADFITDEYFKGIISLPVGEYSNIELFMTQFEAEILKRLLGYELYDLMINDSESEPYKSLIEGKEYTIEDGGRTKKVKWNGFKNDEQISFIAYYIYCYYIRDKVTSTQTVGETKSKQENSENANIFVKMMQAQSRFEELYGYYGQDKLIPSAYNYLYAHRDDFPEWEFVDMQNNFNSHDL